MYKYFSAIYRLKYNLHFQPFVEEFGALRAFGLRPPKDVDVNDLSELVAQADHAQIPLAINLAKKAMKIPSPEHELVKTLLGKLGDFSYLFSREISCKKCENCEIFKIEHITKYKNFLIRN